MINATKKWIFLKISSIILIPLMMWFIINFVSIYDQSHTEVLAFFNNQPAKFLLSLFLITAFFHSALTISEIFEDYIHVEKIKIPPPSGLLPWASYSSGSHDAAGVRPFWAL